jgi:small subunit ribosomal protein S11
MIKKTQLKKDTFACLYITCTFKNTLLTLTNSENHTLGQYSSRRHPSKVKRKNNPYILQQIAMQIIKKLSSLHYRSVYVIIRGVGMGRYQIIKHLKKRIKIFMVLDNTNVPFNGCRLPKIKRK